jgi:pimeloyl-ACP methyl ester carboxylesterase
MPLRNPQNLLRMTEVPRAGLEIASLVASSPFLGFAPRGDRHPVVVIPGFLADDDSTIVLRRFLDLLGYDVYPWGQGRNLGTARMGGYQPLVDHVLKIFHSTSQKVSLVGWSLGGVHALAVADRAGHAVRQLVAMGSPITQTGETTAMFETLRTTARQLNSQVLDTPEDNHRPWRDTLQRITPDLPITTIYSRSDGVVPWQRSHISDSDSGASVPSASAPVRDNIEVYSSHIGLGFNPSVLYAIADRLALNEGEFVRFNRRGWRALPYPTPQSR